MFVNRSKLATVVPSIPIPFPFFFQHPILPSLSSTLNSFSISLNNIGAQKDSLHTSTQVDPASAVFLFAVYFWISKRLLNLLSCFRSSLCHAFTTTRSSTTSKYEGDSLSNAPTNDHSFFYIRRCSGIDIWPVDVIFQITAILLIEKLRLGAVSFYFGQQYWTAFCLSCARIASKKNLETIGTQSRIKLWLEARSIAIRSTKQKQKRFLPNQIAPIIGKFPHKKAEYSFKKFLHENFLLSLSSLFFLLSFKRHARLLTV